MNKVVEMLEKHVQWVALGLGAAYLLFMVWSYALQAPVTDTLNGKTVTLGDVDDETAKGPAQRLKQAMDSQDLVAFDTQPFAEKFLASMDNSREKYDKLTLAGNWTFSQTQKVENKGPDKGPPMPGRDAIAGLPVPPAPDVVEAIAGRSTVVIPPPPPDPAAPAAAGG